MKKQLSTADSIIFSSFDRIFGGPKWFGITIFSLNLKYTKLHEIICLEYSRWGYVLSQYKRKFHFFDWIFTNLKLFPTKCLAMWSIASFSKNIFRWTSLFGSFGGGGFGNSTMISLNIYSQWQHFWQIALEMSTFEKPFTVTGMNGKMMRNISEAMEPIKCILKIYSLV